MKVPPQKSRGSASGSSRSSHTGGRVSSGRAGRAPFAAAPSFPHKQGARLVDPVDPVVWVLTDDRAGNVSQATGVAEALGWPFEVRPIHYTALGHMPNLLRGASLLGISNESCVLLETTLTPDQTPDLVIAAGRRTAPVARWIKRRAGKPCFLCQIMWPGMPGISDFDLVAVPTHDNLFGQYANVMRITGAPHRVTEGRLAVEGARWRDRLRHLRGPVVALIVGGATRRKAFTPKMATDLGKHVSSMVASAGGSLVVTTSRRTGRDATDALFAALPAPGHSFRWGSRDENPYFGYLALADAIVVTGDSVSMVSEACASPAPVFIYAPTGLVSRKHARLHRNLYALGIAEPMKDTFSTWVHPPLNAAVDIARMVRLALLGEEGDGQ
ncbi:nucleoside-diphosphate sugar epimerase [Haematospirillum sp. H4485]|nr:nucleoside-diphosphate sugar epimerase [Haematospirillum sp. H4890]NKD74049.1 nucleoside-diphosphate sugar epimerase [Haematospirillum sp. H4485]